MKICDNPCNPNAGIKLILPSIHKYSPLSVIMKDYESFNIPVLHHVPPRYPWRRIILTECLSNSCALTIDDDEPIIVQGAQDTLAFIRSKDRLKCTIYFHKLTAFNCSLLNGHLFAFDQFEKSCPLIIWTPETKFVVDSAEPTKFLSVLQTHWGLSIFSVVRGYLRALQQER